MEEINNPIIMVRMGEQTLKGRNRHRFERAVLEHLQWRLERFPHVQFEASYGRLYIHLNGESYIDIAERISRTFGIFSFSPVNRCELSLEAIRETALRLMKSLKDKPTTFKVSVRRVNKDFLHDSQSMNNLVGGYILQAIAGLEVDVHTPAVELRIEIREQHAYIFCEIIPGLGGYPSGTNGKAIVMLSGGIDSPVAGWLALKQGLELEAIHFHSFPYTSERAQQKVIELAEQLSCYSRSIVLHMVPFADIQTGLKELGNETLLITLMRRAMLRITTELGRQRACKAIITGDSLGQVASQTLPSMSVIEQAAGMPILRPLIMMDKQEIVSKARMIGTFPVSIQPYEDCCTLFVPKSPSTNPNPSVINRLEQRAAWLQGTMDEAIRNTVTVTITERMARETDSYF
ncbi:MAG: tRNA uracil 4-sulfurtransferase ThiI [Paenibacillaceae bacterium]